MKQETKKANFKTTQELYSIIKNRINSGEYDFVINAGDPDQEGELLVNLVLDQIGNTLPVARFWTNDMTEQAILLNLQNLRNDKTDPMLLNMLAAGKIRQHCDYLFGMNLSSAVRAKMKDKPMLLLYDILEFLPAIGQPIVILGTLRNKQGTSIGVHTLEGIRLGKRRNF